MHPLAVLSIHAGLLPAAHRDMLGFMHRLAITKAAISGQPEQIPILLSKIKAASASFDVEDICEYVLSRLVQDEWLGSRMEPISHSITNDIVQYVLIATGYFDNDSDDDGDEEDISGGV